MDYSLQNLNKNLKLNNLSLSKFVETLNLIGIEIDEISYAKLFSNVFVDDITILLKIPANREDLLNEKFFLKEIATIFLVEIYSTWEKLKQNYSFLLGKKYVASRNYSTFFLPSTLHGDILKYVITVENAKVKSSPSWLQNRLLVAGLTPVNNINDILNLVFSEWGQNFNLFLQPDDSFAILQQLSLECLVQEENYIDHYGHSILLYPGTVILKEKISQKIISVLGIIHSSFQVQENTSLVSFFLEATFYDIHANPLFVNTVTTKISLKSLRRACLENFKFSFQRVLTLLEILTSCSILPQKYCTELARQDITMTKILPLRKKNVSNFLNIATANPFLFQQAGLPIIGETATEYYFKIPVYRHDLAREIDLLEEYSRFLGYKNFQEILPTKDVRYTKSLFRQKYFVKNFFLTNGFHEIITNPIADLENQNERSVLINNPLNNELSTLRRSLLPKLLEVFELNSRSFYPRTNFFEFGRTFQQMEQKIIEQDMLSGIFQLPILTSMKNSSSDWFVAKGILENFLTNFNYEKLQCQKISCQNKFFHPSRTVVFSSAEQILGVFGEIHPLIRKQKYGHLRRPIYLFEFNSNYLKDWQLTSGIKMINEYSKYPLIVKDLSILVSKDIHVYKLKQFIFSQSSLLKNVSIFDIYFDEKVIEKVNLGIRVEFQSFTETLTGETIEGEVEKIKQAIDEKISLLC